MLGRYLILIDWDDASLATSLPAIERRTGLACAHQFLHGLAFTNSRGLALPMMGGQGVAIGDLFPRHGPAATVVADDKQWQAELNTKDAVNVLRDRFWGGYVAVILGDGSVKVARGPGGEMPCYYTRLPSGWAAASDAGLLVEAGLLAPCVAWNQIPRYLVAKDLPNVLTAIEGLEELLPGTFATFSPNARDITTFWSPWVHVTEPDIWDGAAVAERLRRTVDHCIACWASTACHGLATLSGGLDSSIVVAGLSNAKSDFQCITLATENRNGDERDYARAMANAAGAELLEGFYDDAEIDLSRSVARHFPKPIGQIHEVAYHAEVMRMAGVVGADAIFTGNGGDNVFYNSSSLRAFFDCLYAEGCGIEAMKTLANIAEVTEVSVPDALMKAIRSSVLMRRPYEWRLDVEMMANEVAQRMKANSPRHAWLESQKRSRPGKAGHVAFLLRVQNHLEGYVREFGMPMVNPLMSQPVVELALSIPTWKMIGGGRDRAIARNAYADALPPLVRGRRRKGSPSGFAMDVLNRRPKEIRERLLDGELIRRRLVDRVAVETALSRESAMGLSYIRLLTLLDMEAWLAHWSAQAGGSLSTRSVGSIAW